MAIAPFIGLVAKGVAQAWLIDVPLNVPPPRNGLVPKKPAWLFMLLIERNLGTSEAWP